MREIMFRGKRIDNGEWVYGYYGELTDGEITNSYIMTNTFSFTPNKYIYFTDNLVKSETVGQYTEVKDKKGVEIFEGDIIIREIYVSGTRNEDFMGEVKMYEGRWWIDNGQDAVPLWTEIEELSILGNIYQNPELLNS